MLLGKDFPHNSNSTAPGKFRKRYVRQRTLAAQLGVRATGTRQQRPRCHAHTPKEDIMGRGLLLWLIGIPLPIILLLWLFGAFA